GLSGSVPATMRSSIAAAPLHPRRSGGRRRRAPLRPALLALDGLEKGAEVAGPKPVVAFALDDLEEERPRLRVVVKAGRVLEDDLEQVLMGLAPVDQDLQLAQDVDALVDAAHAQAAQALRQHVVVAA